MTNQRLDRLRELREAKRLDQSTLARTLSISQSYLSRLERGEVAPTHGVIDKLAQALGVPESALSSESSFGGLAHETYIRATQETLSAFNAAVSQYGRTAYGTMRQVTKRRPPPKSEAKQSPSILATPIAGQDSLAQALRQLIVNAHGLPEPTLVALCGSTGGLLGAIEPFREEDSLVATLDDFVAARRGSIKFGIASAPWENRSGRLLLLARALALTIKYHSLSRQLTSTYERDTSLDGLDPLANPFDYFIVDPSFGAGAALDIYALDNLGAIFAFHHSPTIVEGFSLDASVPSCTRYLTHSLAFGHRPVHVFGPNVRDSERFQRETSRGVHTRYQLWQEFLGSVTRPIQHFQVDSPWWQRNAKRYSTIRQIADARRERHLATLRQLGDNIVFQQICSREALERWAATGQRFDLDTPMVPEETTDEQVERLDLVVDLLDRFSDFEIAVVDKSDWAKDEPKGASIRWAVADDHKVLMERRFYENDYLFNKLTEMPDRGDAKLRVIIDDTHMSRAFSYVFDQRWKNLKKQYQDKAEVIRFLMALRDRIATRDA